MYKELHMPSLELGGTVWGRKGVICGSGALMWMYLVLLQLHVLTSDGMST